jgi:hypothetical protein
MHVESYLSRGITSYQRVQSYLLNPIKQLFVKGTNLKRAYGLEKCYNFQSLKEKLENFSMGSSSIHLLHV